MMRGEFDRAAIALSEAAEIAAAGAARQERLVVASAGEWLEVLTGGAIPAPAGRADLANRVDVVGTWELMHAMASLRRLVLEREWDRVGDLADRELPFTTGTIRFEALLACVLMTAGRVADAAARAGALLIEADRRQCPLQSIEAHLVLAECGDSSDHAFEALVLAARYGLVLAQIDALEMLAVAAGRAGEPDRAARLKCAALVARDEIGYRFRWPSREAAFDAIEMSSAAPVDSLDDAVAYVLRGRGERRRPAFGWESLTPTELDVARNVARGLTNPQVGERLHIGAATVKTHLEHIYAKLSINSRAELAAQVARREPLPAQD